MWTDNTRNATVKRDQKCLRYLTVMKILIRILFQNKASKITRGHNYTLVKKQSRLHVRKYSFSLRTIEWNKLSTECVHASSVNMFKNRIDKYLVKAGYTWNNGRLHVKQ